MKNVIKQHPVLMYFVLAFLISWSGVLLVVGFDKIVTSGPTDDQMPLLFLAMCAGPSISGMLLTYLCDGRQGLRHLKTRLLKWNVKGRWYAVALLTAPVLILAILLALSLVKSTFFPTIFSSGEKASLLLFGILGGLMAGICEELGWTGFAIPKLRLRYGIVATGLIVGFFWGLWHFLLFLPGDPSGDVPSILYFIVILFTHLPAYRILMVWLYDRTNSVFVTILMHTSLTACTLTLQPATTSGVDIVINDLVLTAVIWIFIAFVVRKTLNKGYQE